MAENRTLLSGWGLVAALVSLLAFGALVWFMITQRDVSETTWTRLAWLFASVEAIAFGAAGALFGSTIQRQQTDRAERRADRNAEDASNGRALATTLIADAPGTPAGDVGLESLAQDARSAAATVAARHAEFARQLFPEILQ